MNRSVLIGITVALAAFLAYANSLSAGFVYDDRSVIVENPLIRRAAFLTYLAGTAYWSLDVNAGSGKAGGLYRPVTMASYSLNYAAGGLAPFGYHAVNLLLHVLVCLLLLSLLRRWGLSERGGAAAALVFALLPVHAEAVTSVVGRAELLAAFFLLGAWLLADHLPAALALFGLALLSKESAAVFPALLLVSDIAGRKRLSLRLLAKKRAVAWASFAIVLALYFQWRYLILGAVFHTGDGTYFGTRPAGIVWLTMARFLISGYLMPTITGLGLQAEYPPGNFPDAGYGDLLAWAALLLALGTFAWSVRGALVRRDLGALGVLLFFLGMMPVSNLLFRIGVIGAERFLYLPSLGLCLYMGARLDPILKLPSWKRQPVTGLLLVCLLGWSLLTLRRNADWKDEKNFWSALARRMPESPRPENGLGAYYGRLGNHERARAHYLRAVALDGTHTLALYNLGKSYYEGGDHAEAEKWFRRSLEAGGPDTSILCFLGLIAQSRGESTEAAAWYERALRLNPYYPTALRNLGLLLYRGGRHAAARRVLEPYLQVAASGDEKNEIVEMLQRAPAR